MLALIKRSRVTEDIGVHPLATEMSWKDDKQCPSEESHHALNVIYSKWTKENPNHQNDPLTRVSSRLLHAVSARRL